MSNGTRAVTPVTTTEVVNYTYALPDGTALTVYVQDGLMSLSGTTSAGAYSATLPLATAPVMLLIAQDMVAELAANPLPSGVSLAAEVPA